MESSVEVTPTTSKLYQYRKPLGALVVLVILLGAYFTRDKWMPFFTKDSGGPSSALNTTNKPSNSSTAANTIDKTKVLKQGDRGESVRELQRLLNIELKKGTTFFLPLVEDGIFGPKTLAILKKITNQSSISIQDLESKMTKS